MCEAIGDLYGVYLTLAEGVSRCPPLPLLGGIAVGAFWKSYWEERKLFCP